MNWSGNANLPDILNGNRVDLPAAFAVTSSQSTVVQDQFATASAAAASQLQITAVQNSTAAPRRYRSLSSRRHEDPTAGAHRSRKNHFGETWRTVAAEDGSVCPRAHAHRTRISHAHVYRSYRSVTRVDVARDIQHSDGLRSFARAQSAIYRVGGSFQSICNKLISNISGALPTPNPADSRIQSERPSRGNVTDRSIGNSVVFLIRANLYRAIRTR
jgi:hypothetical protein